MNVVVGDNDSGKSTLVEAINLVLTGRLDGRLISQEFSPFLVNQGATRDYINELSAGGPSVLPPEVSIDLFLEDREDVEQLRGTNNVLNEDACGVRIYAHLNEDYLEEYRSFVENSERVRLVPAEYYRVDWLAFSGNGVSVRSIPATASVIDPATIRLQSGADAHLQRIVHENLDPRDRAELSLTYRNIREEFGENESIKNINEKLRGEQDTLTDRDLSLSIDISRRFTWESSLVVHLDALPFPFIGRGEQNAVKTLLAIGRKAEDAHIVLIEEPENHLSFSSMRQLVSRILERCEGKQVVVATHSTFVLNRLGLENLVLLGAEAPTRITDLPDETAMYFKKLSGYDTLRLVLAKAALLVEGPSDELVVQRAYRDAHGRDPIDDGVDIINVRGLSFRRFLDLAVGLQRNVTVLTDNDGRSPEEVKSRYRDYTDREHVRVFVGDDPKLETLEYQLVFANEVGALNRVLGTDWKSHDELVEYMLRNKTSSALRILESDEPIVMPSYIRNAVE